VADDLPLTRALSARARALAELPGPPATGGRNASGVLKLCGADPDLPPPTAAVAATQAALEAGLTRYAPRNGLLALREAIVGHLRHTTGLEYDARREILVTNGSQEALHLAAEALLDPGELLLVPDPRFDGYDLAAMLAGGDVEPVPTRRTDGYQPRAEAVDARVTPQTKALVVNSPHNPTGAVYEPATLAGLAEVARQRDLMVISDEVYDLLTFDGAEHRSIAALPGMRERTVVVGSVSKVFAMPGWRIGWLAAPAPFVEAIGALRCGVALGAATFAQAGAAAALTDSHAHVQSTLAEYAARREYVRARLTALGLPCPWSRGAFFLFPDIRRTGERSVDLAERLLREVGVQVQAGRDFGPAGSRAIQLSVLQPLPALEHALDRIATALAGVPAATTV
jgi:aminotransferase